MGEQDAFWRRFAEAADDVAPTGNLVPGAHRVALMLENGVRTILTRDRDYRKFRGITVRDPFANWLPSEPLSEPLWRPSQLSHRGQIRPPEPTWNV